MDPYALPVSPQYEEAVFTGNSATAGANWQTWTKPVGKSFARIIAIGGGGGGGAGAIGANSTAAGGGGGGAGATTVVKIPLSFLPSRLYISVGIALQGAGLASYVSIAPATTANFIVAFAAGGGLGGNASGATAGGAGSSGAVATAANMPLGWTFEQNVVAGIAGTSGGVAASAASVSVSTTGARVNPGTGGGGLPAAATSGTSGGSYTLPTAPTYFPAHPGGVGSASTTAAADPGHNGYRVDMGMGGYYYYGGTGGASTNGSATGAGLTQAPGGNGAVGSGGGGSGGALTGSAAAANSFGGPGLVIITCF